MVEPFQLQGQEDLLELAYVGAIQREPGIPGQLLGYGARALDDLAAHDIDVGRPEYAAEVNPQVLEEAVILNGDEGVDDMVGDLVQRNQHPVLGAMQLGDQLALAVVKESTLARLGFEAGEDGQSPVSLPDQVPGDRRRGERCHQEYQQGQPEKGDAEPSPASRTMAPSAAGGRGR